MAEAFIEVDGRRLRAVPPYPTADFAYVENWTCACGSSRVAGKDMTHDHDTYRSVGYCVECGVRVGPITAKVDTIFGIEEDDRVLNGRCRVY